jgi:hypothetical protein
MYNKTLSVMYTAIAKKSLAEQAAEIHLDVNYIPYHEASDSFSSFGYLVSLFILFRGFHVQIHPFSDLVSYSNASIAVCSFLFIPLSKNIIATPILLTADTYSIMSVEI